MARVAVPQTPRMPLIRKKSKSKNKNNLIEEEEEEDLGPGEVSEAKSKLGKLLMANSRVELAMEMSAAGEAINVRDIQIFTQKGLFARRIMDQMGLPDLNQEIGELKQAPTIPSGAWANSLNLARTSTRAG